MRINISNDIEKREDWKETRYSATGESRDRFRVTKSVYSWPKNLCVTNFSSIHLNDSHNHTFKLSKCPNYALVLADLNHW